MLIFGSDEMNINSILRNHKLWIDSEGKEGEQANLKGADLEGANLFGADLRGANLEGANLIGADLETTFLNNIKGKEIYTYTSSKHFAYYCDGVITIGCQSEEVSFWLENYEKLGKEYNYSEKEIASYGRWIKLMSTL